MVQLQSLAVVATFFAGHSTAAIQMYPSPWGTGIDGEWADAYAKARDFVSQLTVTEKVNLTTGTGWEMDRCVGMTGGIPRLNFSALCLQDSPVGVRYGDFASVFPAGINAAATWSRSLLRRRGAAMGDEFRGKGVDVQLGPVAGPLGRFPEGGRNWEGFGPDPWLAGASVAETIRGIQSAGVIATVKHFIMNEQEHYRSQMNVRIDDKTMHEVFLWPFADAVRAGVGAVMCSYNKVNGANSCENPWTSNYLLKNELNFQGFLMSDWNGQHSTVNSALSGLDMSMPGDRPVYWGGELTAAVMAGVIPQWRLDDMAVRIMAAYFKVHVGNHTSRVPINFSSWTNATYGYVNYAVNRTVRLINEHVDVFTPNKALARELAAKSIVLLKNENRVLPLGDTPKSIAVIGEDAQDNPNGPNACPDRRCDTGTLAMGYGSGTSDFPYLVSPYTALAAEASRRGVSLTNVPGNYDLTAAQRAAAAADVALVFANADAGEGYITIDGNTGDRNNLTLWKGGDALVQAVAAVNPRTVLVLHTVGPVLIEAYRNHPNVSAIVWAGLPGQESGNALIDVLYGATNPQGKTVFTWGKNLEDWGVSLVFNAPNPLSPSQEVNDTLIDYRYFDKYGIEPSYEFGFGLSYTTFEFSDLDITRHVDVLAQGYAPPANGTTGAAKTYGVVDNSTAGVQAAMMPAGFDAIPKYVYSWLSVAGLSGVARNQAVPAGSRDSGPQPVLPASGAPGGNPSLYDVLFTVSAKVANTGSVNGTEIAQMYVAFGDPNEPVRVLRGFEEVELNAGGSSVVSFNLTRRDLSNWDTASQNWVLGKFKMSVAVGSSSRILPLNGTLAL